MFRLVAMAASGWLACAAAQAATLYLTNAGQADGTGSSISVIDANRLRVTATLDLGKSGPSAFQVIADCGGGAGNGSIGTLISAAIAALVPA